MLAKGEVELELDDSSEDKTVILRVPLLPTILERNLFDLNIFFFLIKIGGLTIGLLQKELQILILQI